MQRFDKVFKPILFPDTQPVSKVVKFGYLLQLVKGALHDLIGNIRNTDEGYERALMILKEQFGQDKSVINAHIKEIIDLGTVRSKNSMINWQSIMRP